MTFFRACKNGADAISFLFFRQIGTPKITDSDIGPGMLQLEWTMFITRSIQHQIPQKKRIKLILFTGNADLSVFLAMKFHTPRLAPREILVSP